MHTHTHTHTPQIGLLNRFQRTEPEGFILAVIIASLDLILIGATMIIILVYAFRKQALLHPEIANSRELVSSLLTCINAFHISKLTTFTN